MKTRLFLTLTVAMLSAFMLCSCEKDNGKEQDGNGTENPENPDNPDNPGQKNRLPRPELKLVSSDEDPGDFYIEWKAVEHASKYYWTLDGSQPDSTENTRVLFDDLGTGDFVINVKAVSGSEEWTDSFYASITVCNRPSTPEYEEWLGTYTLTSDKTLVHAKDSGEENVIKDQEMTLDITVDTYGALQAPDGKVYKGYKIFGLSKEFPEEFTVAVFEHEVTQNMILLNQVTYGDADEEGFIKQWMGYGEMGTQMSILPGFSFYPFTFSKADGVYTVTAGKVPQQSGEIVFKAYDLVHFNPDNMYYYTDVAESAYGDFTMVRTGDAVRSNAPVSENEPVCSAIVIARD